MAAITELDRQGTLYTLLALFAFWSCTIELVAFIKSIDSLQKKMKMFFLLLFKNFSRRSRRMIMNKEINCRMMIDHKRVRRRGYFRPPDDRQNYFLGIFGFNARAFNGSPLSNFLTTDEQRLVVISSDFLLRIKFSSLTLLRFWYDMKGQCPEVSYSWFWVVTTPLVTLYLDP